MNHVATYTPARKAGLGVLVVSLIIAVAGGCDSFRNPLTRQPLPDLGPRLPISVKLDFDPSLTAATFQYIDSCNGPHEVALGKELEAVLIDASAQNFNAVTVGNAPPTTPLDSEILVGLTRSGVKLQTDNVYDRIPAELSLEANVVFKDTTGKVLEERTLTVQQRTRLLLEPTQHRCDFGNMGAFVYDSALNLAVQFVRAARVRYDAGQFATAPPPVAPASQTPLQSSTPSPNQTQTAGLSPPSVGARPPIASAVSFRTTILDENSNLVLEGGERVKVRIDVVNTSVQPVQGLTATLTGSPDLLTNFPATTLPVGTLQPGESKSLEFAATLPQTVQSRRADLQVALSDAAGNPVSAPQSLAVSIRSGGLKADDVDVIPVAPPGFRRPHTFLVSIGLSTYRDQQIQARKFASLDAEMIASYFKSLGGIPAANVRLLQDWKALRPDIEEVFFDWLPTRVTPDSVVIVYFAGQAVVTPTGETFLVPYDGSLSSPGRLYPMKDFETTLARLKVQQVLFLFDGPVVRQAGNGAGKPPRWDTQAGSFVRLIGTGGLGGGFESDKFRHGVFTYYVLRGLRGEADTSHDGEVSLGELAAFVTKKVPAAAKSGFNQDQRPLVVPPLRASDKASSLVLTHPPSIQTSAAP
jgi:hypothetical protein